MPRVLAMLAFLGLGCGSVRSPAADAQVSPRPVDLLIVVGRDVDGPEFPSHLSWPLRDGLMDALPGRGLDVRMGGVTSNLGNLGDTTGCNGFSGNTDGDGARLLVPSARQESWLGSCTESACDPQAVLSLETWPPWLELPDLVSRGAASLWQGLWCVLQCGSGGGWAECRVHQPLLAAVRAAGVNPGFVREDSVWAVLIAVQVDDFSTADPRLWSNEMRLERQCWAGYRSGDLLVPVGDFVAQLRAAAATRPVVVGVVAAAGELHVNPPEGLPACTEGWMGLTCTTGGGQLYAAPRLYQLAAAIEALQDPNLRAVTIDSCAPPSSGTEEPYLPFRPFFDAVIEAATGAAAR